MLNCMAFISTAKIFGSNKLRVLRIACLNFLVYDVCMERMVHNNNNNKILNYYWVSYMLSVFQVRSCTSQSVQDCQHVISMRI